MIEKPFKWNEEKNRMLQKNRGLSFEAIVIALENGHLIDICDHPTKPHQQIFEIDMEGYIIRVPFVEDDKKVFLKTAYHCRKATKKHLGKKNHDH